MPNFTEQRDSYRSVFIGAQCFKEFFFCFAILAISSQSVAQTFPANFELSKLDGTNGIVIKGTEPRGGLGRSISNAGDVNGDGIDDIVIGSPNVDLNGKRDAGVCYIIFGKDNNSEKELNISSLNGNNGFIVEGGSEGDFLGSSVSSAGDINGDGIDDIIIGAPGASGVRPDFSFSIVRAGRSYVIYGRSNFDTVLQVDELDANDGFSVIGGELEGSLGNSVSSAGDVNGDGLSDIIIGAPTEAVRGISRAGKSYVIFGKNSNFSSQIGTSEINGSNGFAVNGKITFNISGTAVSGAGDINGDGFDDVVIGAPGAAPNDVPGAGEIYVVFGASSFAPELSLSSLDGTNGFTFIGIGADDRLGRSISGLGDINADGLDDIIIGAQYADPNNRSQAGESYIILGSEDGFPSKLNRADLDGSNGFTVFGRTRLSESGNPVSSAGDVNGDGLNDLFIGAPFAKPDDISVAGESYVIFGSSTNFEKSLDLMSLNGSNGFVLSGIDGADFSGSSLSTAGDFNNDGIDDLLIGAPLATYDGIDRPGEVYIVFGGGFQNTAPILVDSIKDISILTGFDSLTVDLSGTFSDPDGDSLALTATSENEMVATGTLIGDTLIIFENGIGTTTLTIAATDGRGGEIKEFFVVTILPNQKPVVDLALRDFAIKAGFGEIVVDVGAVFTDPEDDSLTYRVEFENELVTTGQIIDSSLKIVEEGIGTNEITVIAIDTEGNEATDAFIVSVEDSLSGSSFPIAFELGDLNGSNGFSALGTDFWELAGSSVSDAGDLNGDGIDDIIIGARGGHSDDLRETGRVYAIFGRREPYESEFDFKSLDGSNGFIIYGTESSELIGIGVNGGGDINGDGFSDIIIQADNKTYILFGKSSFTPIVDLSTLDGSNGFYVNNGVSSVSHAGDINGDGLGDIIIGGTSNDPEDEPNVGSCYVIFGKNTSFETGFSLASLDGENGFIIRGAFRGDRLGSSVSSAGDFNGDGIDDIIIGAANANTVEGGGAAGKSYVVFGHTGVFKSELRVNEMNRKQGIQFNGNRSRGRAGYSVSDLGDINGDGIDDIIIGGPGVYQIGQDVTIGGSYVVFGSKRGFKAEVELSQLNGIEGFIINGFGFGDGVGRSVSDAGDINNDGLNDIIIGANSAFTGQTVIAGGVFIIFGSEYVFSKEFDLIDLDGSNGYFFGGEEELSLSGANVSFAGDVNDDGSSDLIVGVQDILTAGKVYVLFGSEKINTSNTVPLVTSALDNLEFVSGFLTQEIDLQDLFTDADGDVLSYIVSSSDESVATVSTSGTMLVINEVGLGRTEITVTANDGKGGSVDETFVLDITQVTAIHDEQSDRILLIYPNPSSSDVTIQFGKKLSGLTEVFIYNLNGQTLLQKRIDSKKPTKSINLDLDLSDGQYILRLTNGDHSFVKNFLIVK